jgi:hypothetical protein
VADRGIARHPDQRGGALSRLMAGAAALVLILAACGSTAGSPAATSTPAPTPVAIPEISPSPEPTASPVATPTPTQVAVGECTPGGPSALSLDWVEQVSLSGDYRFARPADWADLSAEVKLPTNTSVSPGTFSETGLPADAEHQVDFVRSFDGNVGVSAWVIDGVTTRTDDLFTRELAWLGSQPQVKTILDEELEACIGGSRARGFSSTWSFPSGDMHIVIYLLQRGGKMYEVQLTATDPARVDILAELLNSWEFSAPVGPPADLDDEFAATDFRVIGMATEVDKSIPGHPNPATFQNVFPAMSEFIYVIYELDDGAKDTVHFSWKKSGREFVVNQFDYKETTTFAWGWITPDATGLFATGSYTVTLSLENSGDTITVPLTIE